MQSSRAPAAAIRAALAMATVVVPALVVPGADPSISSVMALLVGLFVLFEYGARTPALVDFRQAPPINRLRFAIFCVTLAPVVAFVAAAEGAKAHSAGLWFGETFGGPWSPASLAADALRRPAALKTDPALMAAAAIASVSAGVATAVFAALVWFGRWPGAVDFDRWTNLTTFDPTGAGNAPDRLAAQARLVFLTGLALPVALLGAARLAEDMLAPDAFSGGLTLVWGATLWAAGTGAVLLRGVAMLKLARRLRSEARAGGG